MSGLHGLTAPLAIVGLSGMAVAATALAVMGRDSRALDLARRIALGVLVAESAVGLALAIRGGGPAEGIHWVYGVAVVVLLTVPATLADHVAPRARAITLAVGSAVAAAVAWRLWASG